MMTPREEIGQQLLESDLCEYIGRVEDDFSDVFFEVFGPLEQWDDSS